jgi:hypothetical protein
LRPRGGAVRVGSGVCEVLAANTGVHAAWDACRTRGNLQPTLLASAGERWGIDCVTCGAEEAWM